MQHRPSQASHTTQTPLHVRSHTNGFAGHHFTDSSCSKRSASIGSAHLVPVFGVDRDLEWLRLLRLE
ncbi:hypothetical protein BaRGS_00023571, partial [Batillaria attramentaria]